MSVKWSTHWSNGFCVSWYLDQRAPNNAGLNWRTWFPFSSVSVEAWSLQSLTYRSFSFPCGILRSDSRTHKWFLLLIFQCDFAWYSPCECQRDPLLSLPCLTAAPHHRALPHSPALLSHFTALPPCTFHRRLSGSHSYTASPLHPECLQLNVIKTPFTDLCL